MLLEFRTKNYKSFFDELVFSMMAAPKQTGLDYSVQNVKIGSNVYRGLCSAVIYGPNASGKTNIIGAMDSFKSIIMRGHIKNSDVLTSPNQASSSLELIPNCCGFNEPTSFSVTFIEQDLVIKYLLVATLGDFLDEEFDREILQEELYVNDKLVFSRGSDLEVKIPSVIIPYMNEGIKSVTKKSIQYAENSINKKELFLNNGFKTIYSKDLVSLIMNWIENKFIVIYRADAIQSMRKYANPKADTIYVEKTLNEASNIFGVSSNALGYKVSSDGDDVVLCSLFEDKNLAIPADLFESYGTIRFVNEFPLVIRALLTGGTLVMDEFDASIHPMALMNIITIFHNDDLNIYHAQLIFNTHNPIFLSANLFRRDEIKFVERDETTDHSIHYSLSDFKTAEGTRKGEDYMGNYFISKYGAIKDIDFSPIIESLIHRDEENKNA